MKKLKEKRKRLIKQLREAKDFHEEAEIKRKIDDLEERMTYETSKK